MSNSDEDLRSLIADLHDHLDATAELPIDPATNRWLGEAEAVAADIDVDSVSPAVVRKRTKHLHDLLDHIDGTGDPKADDHVNAARRLLNDIEEVLDE